MIKKIGLFLLSFMLVLTMMPISSMQEVFAASTYYVAFNMHWEEHEFDLPGSSKADFVMVLATDPENTVTENRTCLIRPRSVAVFEMQQKENGIRQ